MIVGGLCSCQEKRARDDQGKTAACWIYAMLECVEHEAAVRGDSVQLSRQWLMAKELEEQTQRLYLSNLRIDELTNSRSDGLTNSRIVHTGNSGKGIAGVVSMRGVGPEALRLIRQYGLVPYQNEKTEITNSSVLERKLALLASQARSLDELNDRMRELLPEFTTTRATVKKLPAFYYLSMRYNPLQFAESVMYYQHWHFYASVPYRPYGSNFALEVADNYNHHEYTNLPMDDITAMVLASLKEGHAVYWEYGRRTKDGLVTSDHAIAIVGLVHPKKHHGEPYLKCKNSYGKKWGNNGYCLVSLDEFKQNTCCVGVLE